MKRGVLAVLFILFIAIPLTVSQSTNDAFEVGLAAEVAQEPTNVIIILKDQPLSEVAQEVKEEYQEEIEEQQQKVEEILNESPVLQKELQLPAEEQEKNIREKGAQTSYQEIVESLPEQKQVELNETIDDLNELADEVKQEIYEEQEDETEYSQRKVKRMLESCDATISGESVLINAIFAEVSEDCLDDIQKNSYVSEVYKDHLYSIELDTSVPATNAQTWFDAGYTGSSWDIAVVDTGIDSSHPNLFVKNASVFHDLGKNHFLYDDEANNTDDFQSHGTHIGGIIASNDSTYRGIAHGSQGLINAKFGWKSTTGDGLGFESDAIQAIDWAINDAGADVISYSFGGPYQSSDDCAFCRFLDAVVDDLGVPVAVSAGNDGPSSPSIGVPAIAYNIFSVAAADNKGTSDRNDDSIASYSSRGPTFGNRVKPDIAAPGSSIKAASNTWESSSDFITKSGTSMAAPHIAGSSLLLLQYKGFAWDPKALKALLLNTANNSGSFSDKNKAGWGYLDLDHAFAHKDDVAESTITPSSYLLFKGPAVLNDQATLVWNRHVTYNGVSSGAFYDINDLDLHIYDEETGDLIDSSESPVDNVEQVMVDGNYTSVIIKVRAFDDSFSHGSNESFALATEENIAAANGPQLALSYTLLGNTTDEGFAIISHVTNEGDTTAHNVVTTSEFPGLLQTTSESSNSLATNETQNQTWILSSSVLGELNGTFSYTSTSYNETFSGQTDEISVVVTDDDTLGPSLSNISAPQNASIVDNITISVSIEDPSGIANTTLYYSFNESVGTTAQELTQVGDVFSITLESPGSNHADETLSFYIVSYDNDSDRGNDSASTTSSTQTIQIFNQDPVLTVTDSISTVEGSLVDINASAQDPEGLVVTLNYSSPLNSSGLWQTGYDDAGVYSVTTTATDSQGATSSADTTITILNDADEDGIADIYDVDDDNDGINDSIDTLFGDPSYIDSNSDSLSLVIGGSDNYSQVFVGNQTVEIKNQDGTTLASFVHDFSLRILYLENISLYEEQTSDAYGSIRMGGIELTHSGTKTLYVENVTQGIQDVCVLDEEISSFDTMTVNCTGENETVVTCNATEQSGYICTMQDDYFEVAGLRNSHIRQGSCVESWSCTTYSSCSGGTQTRTCTDANACGTSYTKPSESRSCSSSGGSSGGGGGGGGGGSSSRSSNSDSSSSSSSSSKASEPEAFSLPEFSDKSEQQEEVQDEKEPEQEEPTIVEETEEAIEEDSPGFFARLWKGILSFFTGDEPQVTGATVVDAPKNKKSFALPLAVVLIAGIAIALFVFKKKKPAQKLPIEVNNNG